MITTSPVIRNEHGTVIPNDQFHWYRRIDWRDIQGTSVMNYATQSTAVRAYTLRQEQDRPVARSTFMSSSRACFEHPCTYDCTTDFTIVRSEITPSSGWCRVRRKSKKEDAKPMTQHRGCSNKMKLWSAFSPEAAALFIFFDPWWSEHAFSDLPASLRRLLRFAPEPPRRTPTTIESTEAEVVYDIARPRTFSELLSEATKQA